MLDAKLLTETPSRVESHTVIPRALNTVRKPTAIGSTDAMSELNTIRSTIPTNGAAPSSERIRSSFNRKSKVESTARFPVIQISNSPSDEEAISAITFQCSISMALASDLG